jgi:hypothetical protein
LAFWSFQPTDQPGIVTISKFGEEYAVNQTMNGGSSRENTDRSHEFSEPLTTEWGIREWIGVGIFTFTIITATLLTVVSARLHRLQAQKNLWGLTEEGVVDLLKVGWSYQQEVNGRLFLKVYNKGQLGYSDENSVLNGKVMEESAVQLTATTASPDSLDTPIS